MKNHPHRRSWYRANAKDLRAVDVKITLKGDPKASLTRTPIYSPDLAEMATRADGQPAVHNSQQTETAAPSLPIAVACCANGTLPNMATHPPTACFRAVEDHRDLRKNDAVNSREMQKIWRGSVNRNGGPGDTYPRSLS